MKVQVEDGRIRRIDSHPNNSATPEGVCLKGLSYVERVNAPDRILYPLKRIPGSSEFERTSWDEAIATIVEKLEYFKKSFGPQSILYYAASGTKGLLNSVGMNFWRLFGGCTTTYGDLCWPAGLEATRLTLGENIHNVPWDIANSKLIILWGKNSAETNIHQMYYIEKAIENGAKLVVVDPRRTQSSEQADLLIQLRPGTDGALALGLANLLIKNKKIDIEFIENHVFGFSSFAEMVQDFTVEKVSEICGISIQKIYQLGKYLGEIKPVTINAGFGLQRYTNSGQSMRAILALLALTGNFGKPGAGWIFANLQSALFDKIQDPIAFFPPEKPDGVVRVSISTARLGQEMLETSDPPLKMIWVERGNPVTQNPETNTVLKAFRSLDFRVVVEQFMTDTARESDIILPAKSMFEQSDVIGAYWHSYIQLKQKVMEPPGEVKPETEIYYLLSEKLGISKEEIIDLIPQPTGEAIESFLNKKLEPFPELSLEKLKEGPILAPGSEEVVFSDLSFSTPSGKIELLSKEAEERWGVNQLPFFEEPTESVKKKSVESQKYSLHLMTPNTKNRIHSQFNNLKMIRELNPKPLVSIHPVDAQTRKIQHGDLVKIFNDRGNFQVEAKLDFGVKPGCIAVTNGWWITEGGTVNFCSLGRETDMGHGAAFHDNLVEVERV